MWILPDEVYFRIHISLSFFPEKLISQCTWKLHHMNSSNTKPVSANWDFPRIPRLLGLSLGVQKNAPTSYKTHWLLYFFLKKSPLQRVKKSKLSSKIYALQLGWWRSKASKNKLTLINICKSYTWWGTALRRHQQPKSLNSKKTTPFLKTCKGSPRTFQRGKMAVDVWQ